MPAAASDRPAGRHACAEKLNRTYRSARLGHSPHIFVMLEAHPVISLYCELLTKFTRNSPRNHQKPKLQLYVTNVSTLVRLTRRAPPCGHNRGSDEDRHGNKKQQLAPCAHLYRLTFELPGGQHQPQSGILLLTVRAERKVSHIHGATPMMDLKLSISGSENVWKAQG